MIIEITGTPVRDLSTIDFSSITNATITNIQVPSADQDIPYAIEFSTDLTDDQISLVVLYALSTANQQSMYQSAINAVGANNNYLAIASPTNAQVVTQVNHLTKECTGLIKLMLRQLSSTAGT